MTRPEADDGAKWGTLGPDVRSDLLDAFARGDLPYHRPDLMPMVGAAWQRGERPKGTPSVPHLRPVAADGREANPPSLVEAALSYLDRGWSVLPTASIEGSKPPGTCGCYRRALCGSPGKHPRTRGWRRWTEERPSPAQVREWWERWPRANLAVVTGAISGLTVIDLDGERGVESWRLSPWADRADSGLWQVGLAVRTGVGMHLYYRAPGRPTPNRVGLLPGVDVRGDRGIVVAPPSVHQNGQLYGWIGEGLRDLPEPEPMPDDLRDAILDR